MNLDIMMGLLISYIELEFTSTQVYCALFNWEIQSNFTKYSSYGEDDWMEVSLSHGQKFQTMMSKFNFNDFPLSEVTELHGIDFVENRLTPLGYYLYICINDYDEDGFHIKQQMKNKLKQECTI